MPIVSKFLLYRNPSLQFWHRGWQNPVLLLLSPHLLQILLTISSVDMTFVFFRFKYLESWALFSFTLVTSCRSSSLLSANRVVSSAYISNCLFFFLPFSFRTMSSSSRFACLMMYSLYRLNRYGERTHPCLTPFPIDKLSVSPYSVRTFASWFDTQSFKWFWCVWFCFKC